MKKIDELIKQKKIELKEDRKNIFSSRIFLLSSENKPLLTFDEFKELIKINSEKQFAKRGQNKIYVFDKFNLKIIEQFYFYITKNDQFNGNFEKGIFLIGKNGVGKTILMNSFIEIIEDLSRKRFEKVHSLDLHKKIKENENINYCSIPLYIEDLGKENKIINDFGTQIQTIPNLFHLRYKKNAWTFVCCNYNKETLIKFYGITIYDRFKEMFNAFKLSGESKRF